MVQASGRAGRGDKKGQVLIQIKNQQAPAIKYSLKHDFLSFYDEEIEQRKIYMYPPFSRMIKLEFSCLQINLLDQWSQFVGEKLKEITIDFKGVKVQGPMSPPIERIRGRIRKSILFVADDIRVLHQVVAKLLLRLNQQPRAIRLSIDVDPQSFL